MIETDCGMICNNCQGPFEPYDLAVTYDPKRGRFVVISSAAYCKQCAPSKVPTINAVDADLFECEECNVLLDSEESVRRGEKLICELCKEQLSVSEKCGLAP